MTVKRLSSKTIASLDSRVRRFAYDRANTAVGIAHLGVGAFMRSHLAVYCDDAMELCGGDWAIAGVSLRHPGVRNRLEPQDGLYTVGEFGTTTESLRLVGSLKSVTVAPEDPAAVVRLLANPKVKVITLTVTEKGYTLHPDSGELWLDHPDIRHDLEHPGAPRSTIGFLAEGLKARMKFAAAPPSIVSCDNLPGNGARLRAAVLGFADRTDSALRDWISDTVTFPATMVDRIVPAATPEDIERNAARIGLRDDAFVKTEAFCQWVIEDAFCNQRPHWEAGGALLVADVRPFEQAKLRLLNGAHSTIAYLGCLAGFDYVHEAMQDRDFAAFIRALMKDEISPVTPEPPPLNHDTYIEELLARFANTSLMHRTRQIAMDGSQKLPQRLLDAVRAQLEREGPIDCLSLAVAGWMRYALGRDESGNPYGIDDPLAARFAAVSSKTGGDPAAITAGFLGIREVFGADLPKDARFRGKVTESLGELMQLGARRAVRNVRPPVPG